MQPVEAFVLSRLETGEIRIHDLLAISGLPETETLRAVYALAFGGFVRRDHWPHAFTEAIVVRAQAAARKAAERQQQEEQPALTSEGQTARPSPVAEKTPERDERAELEQFFARLNEAEDFYQALGVSQTAETNAIKQAYHQLARRFHPDRFHHEAGTPLHTKLQTSFARLAQAYEILRDPQSRSAYDLKIEAQKKLKHQQTSSGHSAGGGSAAQFDAEESFKRGLAALKANNLPQAMALLGEAARLAPKQPRYRAYYGLALSANRQTRHQAETELQAAISLDAKNASYHVMLAELYLSLGMKRRAQGELQRTLTLDPKNAEARRLLDDMNGKG